MRTQRDLADPAAVPTEDGSGLQLTLPRQSETVGPTAGLGGRQDADQDSGNTGGFCRRFFAARGRRGGADCAAGDADRAGIAARRRAIHAAPGSTAPGTASDLSPFPGGARRRLPPVFPRPERRAGVQRDLCAGIPAKRHRDRAPHELLLAPGLAFSSEACPDLIRGWIRVQGLTKVDWVFTIATAACNLMRAPKLLAEPA
jgi:hypothetical protein